MEKNISDFLNDEYKKFSYHIIEHRSLGSIVDGYKPSTRKAIYVGEKYVRGVYNTVETLAGRLVSDAFYHHGSVSGEGILVNSTVTYKQNLPMFQGYGSFGSLYQNTPASSRYIKVKLHENFDLVFKDKELLEYIEEDGQIAEPKYYLPLVPLILLNSIPGIAVGFATNILNREAKPLIKDCLSYLKGGKISKLPPYIDTFNGTFTVDKDNHKKWYIKGKFQKENSTTVRVTELVPSMTYEKWEEILDNLIEKKLITNWENVGKGKIDYIIKFNKESLSSLSDADIDKMLKLTDQVTENFTVLDEFGKLKIFDSAEEILKYFVDFRLGYYQKRKDYLLKKIKEDIFKMESKALFIKCVLDGKIVINNKKKDDIIKDIEKVKIQPINNSYDYLLTMPIYSLSKEKWDELQKEIKDKKIEEKEIKMSIPKEVYLSELDELMKKIK
jgi:DNA topoisomerase-2